MPETSTPIVAGARIGHVHLKVADLDRALAFYCGVLGFRADATPAARARRSSRAGGYHHHIGLNTWESQRRPSAGAAARTGLVPHRRSSIRRGRRWPTPCTG